MVSKGVEDLSDGTEMRILCERQFIGSTVVIAFQPEVEMKVMLSSVPTDAAPEQMLLQPAQGLG